MNRLPVAVQRRALCAVHHQRRGARLQRGRGDLGAVEWLACVKAEPHLISRPDGVELLPVALQQCDAVEDFLIPNDVVVGACAFAAAGTVEVAQTWDAKACQVFRRPLVAA